MDQKSVQNTFSKIEQDKWSYLALLLLPSKQNSCQNTFFLLSLKVLCVHFPINSKSSFFFIPLDVTIAVTRLLPPMRIDIKAVPRRLHSSTGEPFQIWFPNLLTMLPHNQIELYLHPWKQTVIAKWFDVVKVVFPKDWLVPIVQLQ